MNAFGNVGSSDDLDFPNYAQPVPVGSRRATVGATLRQSELGFEIFGPTIAGSRTSADVQLDFAGGFPATGNGVDFGIVRLQTASLRFDWEHTSVVAGQDSLFISPLSPTSFASLATPTFAFAGNLWGWTPQLRIEHRFAVSDQQTVTVQAGVMDNLDWEYPPNHFYRSAQAGEMSGQPAYAFRTAWSRPVGEHPLSFGVAGYYGRQDWTWGRVVDAWAAMADWQIPILPRLALSGEFYRGRGVIGLGGAVGTSILYGGDHTLHADPRSQRYGWMDSIEVSGDSKSRVQRRLRRRQHLPVTCAASLSIRITSGRFWDGIADFWAMVFRPRSDLLLSAELRRLLFPVYNSSSATNQLNLAIGILF